MPNGDHINAIVLKMEKEGNRKNVGIVFYRFFTFQLIFFIIIEK